MKTPAELEAAVSNYRNGNREEFDKIYYLSHRYLYVCISHMIKDEDTAKDMLQETYMEIAKGISQLQSTEDFLSWAAVIARRKCYAYYNKADRLVLAKEDEDGQEIFDNIADDEAFIPESILQDMEKRRLIREIIDGLSDMQRLCVIAYYYNEQKQDEIAGELGIPVNTVKSHLNRAKAKIKEEILALEREKDTKLYTIAPFMLLFFAEEAEACEAVPMSEELENAVQEEGTKGSGSRLGKLAQLSLKAKILIGVVVILGIVSVIGVTVFRLTAGVSEEESQGQPEEMPEDQGEETPAEENTVQEPETEAAQEEEAVQDHGELAISGIYDGMGMGMGRDGRIVVNSGGKWGLVTYDNQILVPVEYDYACNAPNDDGQTFFGNDGDYKVFDRDGNEIFQTDKPIKAVSEGVALWVQTGDDMSYRFGYVKLDGTVLYESDGEDIDGQTGAVGFNEGYAFFTNTETFGEDRIAEDGTVTDIFAARLYLRHPELLEEQTGSANLQGSAMSAEGNMYYPVGACYEGYYVDRGIDYFEDTSDQFYVYDAQGTEQYWLMIESVAGYAGYPYVWGSDELDWNIRGFYHNGNYCYSNKTKVAVSVSYGGETKSYLIDTAKLERREDGGRIQMVLTDGSVLAQGDYVGIADTAYWLFQKDGQWGYIDQDGNVVQMFDDAAQFYGGTAMAVEDGYAFFIDEEMNRSEWKIPAQSVSGYGEVFVVMTEEGQKCYVAE